MILGMDTAAAGMKARLDQQDAIADNLANVSTVGYHRKTVSFSTFQQTMQKSQSPLVTAQPTSIPKAAVAEDTSPGSLVQTGVPSDIAIEGPGSLVIQSGQNRTLTRAGTLHVNSTGCLATTDGHLVMGENGAIKVTDKDWKVDPDGNVSCNGKTVDKLLIQKDSSANPNATFRVVTGSVEGSNVNAVGEMVNMISAMRTYEACQKSIQSIDGTLDKVINTMQK
jgi:flagellar basal-body rod protein FlgG